MRYMSSKKVKKLGKKGGPTCRELVIQAGSTQGMPTRKGDLEIMVLHRDTQFLDRNVL